MLGLKRRRRRRLRNAEPPAHWLTIIARNIAYVRLLDEAERRELLGHVQVFLDEKLFEGCGGLEVTEEIRVTIAAQACLLLLHRDTDYFPGLRTVLVYPRRYVASGPRRQPDGTVVEGPEVRGGESWQNGAIVLSWDDVRRGAMQVGDGLNVVLHEFAHQLDAESGAMEGAPALGDPTQYAAWARVLTRSWERLHADLEAQRQTFVREYGSVSPAEFFAVVTEAFFERPMQLRHLDPDLYAQLAAYYRQEPAARLERFVRRSMAG
ncbi:MAG: M90 family metallopeptidase [Planctomycetota bacterium]